MNRVAASASWRLLDGPPVMCIADTTGLHIDSIRAKVRTARNRK
ncbi:hypothetical protein [Streptomyces sp. NPDC059970]